MTESTPWTEDEIDQLKTLLLKHGKDWAKILEQMPTKRRDDVIRKTHNIKLSIKKAVQYGDETERELLKILNQRINGWTDEEFK